MRLGLAGGPAHPLAKALVLGSRGTALLIAEQLDAHGYEARLPESPLPSPSDPNAPAELRRLLEGFLRAAGAPSGRYAHLLHPGTSLWAERAELIQIAQELGFAVLAPSPRTVSLFSSQLNLLHEAERLGIPNLVLSFDPIQSPREVEALLAGPKAQQGSPRFPFVLKSVRGEGGFGLRVIHEPEDLERRLPLWLEQLRLTYGEAILFAERYVEGARHVVVPFVRFRDGTFETFPAVDSSLQLRYRKLIEFCPAPSVERGVERQIDEWARKLAERAGFVGVGSFDFLVDSTRAFLLGGVSRLNTSFPLWERVAGTSAVSWQLASAEVLPPELLPERKPRREWASALACRLYAEDPVLELPQPGVVRELSGKREWRLPGAQADLHLNYEAGQEVTPEDDGLLGLLFVGAQERKQALTLCRGILESSSDGIWIAGALQTNERFLCELLNHPWVREGIFHAGFVEEEFVPDLRPTAESLRILAALGPVTVGEESGTWRWAVGDQWVKPPADALDWVAPPVRWQDDGRPGLSGMLRLEDGRTLRACVHPLSDNRWQIRLGSWFMTTRRAQPRQASASGKKRHRLTALVPGKVHSVLFRENSTVPAHEPLLVLESLRVLVPHALPVEATVAKWAVKAEERVSAGQVLAEFEM